MRSVRMKSCSKPDWSIVIVGGYLETIIGLSECQFDTILPFQHHFLDFYCFTKGEKVKFLKGIWHKKLV